MIIPMESSAAFPHFVRLNSLGNTTRLIHSAHSDFFRQVGNATNAPA